MLWISCAQCMFRDMQGIDSYIGASYLCQSTEVNRLAYPSRGTVVVNGVPSGAAPHLYRRLQRKG